MLLAHSDHLKPALDVAHLVAGGHLSSIGLGWPVLARLTALRKATTGKVRPLAVTSVWRRWAMAALMNQHVSLLTTAVGPAQFAVGRSAAL